MNDLNKFFATNSGKCAFAIIFLIIGFFGGMQYKAYQIKSVITDSLMPAITSSLDDAREKANDAKVRAITSSARAQGELYYTSGGNDISYKGVCSDPEFRHLLDGANSKPTCNEAKDGSAWAVAIPMSDSSTYACSDSTGVAIVINYPLGSASSCEK